MSRIFDSQRNASVSNLVVRRSRAYLVRDGFEFLIYLVISPFRVILLANGEDLSGYLAPERERESEREFIREFTSRRRRFSPARLGAEGLRRTVCLKATFIRVGREGRRLRNVKMMRRPWKKLAHIASLRANKNAKASLHNGEAGHRRRRACHSQRGLPNYYVDLYLYS